MSKQKTILIFFVKSGGGHESAAKSIKKEFSKFNHNIILIDMLSGSPKWIQNQFDKGYVNLTENLPWIWYFLNKMWNLFYFNLFTYLIFKFITQSKIAQIINESKPDMILSTYFFGQKISQNILDKNRIKIPNITIVSEIFQAPKIWFTFPGKFLTFSDRAYNIAMKQTEKFKNKSKIIKFGYFFSADYNQLIKTDSREENKPFSILILGGGSSLPNGDKLLKKVLELNHSIDLNIVCGRNEKLYEKCNQIKTQKPNSKINLTIWPFTDQIPALIANSDIIITKGGPAVIFESLSQNKPILIYDFIKPQEKGNVNFVIENNFGLYEPDFDKLLDIINKMIKNPEMLIPYKSRIEKANIKSDLLNIIEYLENQLTSN